MRFGGCSVSLGCRNTVVRCSPSRRPAARDGGAVQSSSCWGSPRILQTARHVTGPSHGLSSLCAREGENAVSSSFHKAANLIMRAPPSQPRLKPNYTGPTSKCHHSWGLELQRTDWGGEHTFSPSQRHPCIHSVVQLPPLFASEASSSP